MVMYKIVSRNFLAGLLLLSKAASMMCWEQSSNLFWRSKDTGFRLEEICVVMQTTRLPQLQLLDRSKAWGTSTKYWLPGSWMVASRNWILPR